MCAWIRDGHFSSSTAARPCDPRSKPGFDNSHLHSRFCGSTGRAFVTIWRITQLRVWTRIFRREAEAITGLSMDSE